MTIKVMRSTTEYPPGLLGVISALFGQSISASHGVDWTLDAVVAEHQCEFFRRFDPERDRVWVVMDGATPKGGLTIEGPRLPSDASVWDMTKGGLNVGRSGSP